MCIWWYWALCKAPTEVLNMYEGFEAVEESSCAEWAHAEREALSVGTGSKIPMIYTFSHVRP